MKKSLTLILSFILLLSFVGCGNDKKTVTSNSDTNTSGSNSVQGNNSVVNNTVVVPDVVGMKVDEAKKKLEEMGLVVEAEVRHLVEKDNNNTSLGYYDDGYVLEQDSKFGTVMIKGSTVKITYNSNTTQFKYTVNEDGTVTLTDVIHTYCPDKILRIPKKYDEFVVTTVDSKLIENFNSIFPHIAILVPKEMTIIGETTVFVEYY